MAYSLSHLISTSLSLLLTFPNMWRLAWDALGMWVFVSHPFNPRSPQTARTVSYSHMKTDQICTSQYFGNWSAIKWRWDGKGFLIRQLRLCTSKVTMSVLANIRLPPLWRIAVVNSSTGWEGPQKVITTRRYPPPVPLFLTGYGITSATYPLPTFCSINPGNLLHLRDC